MRLAVFGDVHGNLEALLAVLEDAASKGCTGHLCTGDLVGYAADPCECIRIVRELECPVVRGNHDEDAAQSTSLEGWNPIAERVMEWTRNQLVEEDKKWLMDLPLVRKIEEITLVHATLDTPGAWTYVTNPFDAMASFSYQFTPLCFYGHTHTPKFYAKAEGDIVISPSLPRVALDSGKKYFINVGSVGQPRDGDWRACYAIYDQEDATVTIHRVDFDASKACQKIVDNGLPPLVAAKTAEPES